jgi:hypothetical protein
MLTAVSSSTGAGARLVNIPGSNFSGSTVVYTVPAGRTFRGHLFARGAENININIGGRDIQLSHTPQTGSSVVPLTLPAGTVVRNPSSSFSYWLIGTEE